ncbi:histidine phosphatase family protein [Parafrigoribacterium soli]|uniref:histidine phosphatase family protein n=1 Tax=Parafrigoribacterium soli TaxID=3144663 RepID=UPI0032F02AEB
MGVRELILVRHGESTANVAATQAERNGADRVDAPLRDADVPLSDTGRRQAEALAVWLRSLADEQFPQAAWCSPYLRAADTASIALTDQRMSLAPRADERLRDRELGILDTYTHRGVVSHYPREDARRTRLGKFYYRPPGGESWADVALRLRSLLADLDRECDGERVLIVAHDAIIMNLRYICERLSERELLELARTEPVLNAAVTILRRPSGTGEWSLGIHNSVEHLKSLNAPVTAHTGDRDVEPR